MENQWRQFRLFLLSSFKAVQAVLLRLVLNIPLYLYPLSRHTWTPNLSEGGDERLLPVITVEEGTTLPHSYVSADRTGNAAVTGPSRHARSASQLTNTALILP